MQIQESNKDVLVGKTIKEVDIVDGYEYIRLVFTDGTEFEVSTDQWNGWCFDLYIEEI